MKKTIRCLVFAILSVIGLTACRAGEPDQMAVAFSAYTDRPVVLTEMAVNGSPQAFPPLVVRGRADSNRPQEGAGRRLLRYPSGSEGVMGLTVTWVELPSGQAYSAQVEVPLAQLQTAASGGIEFMPVFGPGGLLLITSDPVPASANDRTIRDVVRICATRAPLADTDFGADPGALPALREALASATATANSAACSPN